MPRNFDLEDVHVEGAERIADAVAKYDVDRFIHVSSYNADVNSASEFFRTKVNVILFFVLLSLLFLRDVVRR
jgi:uncharacterized protein YbjT (DUF2867 family)